LTCLETKSLDRQDTCPRKLIQIRPLPTCSHCVHCANNQQGLVLAAFGLDLQLVRIMFIGQQSTGLILAALGSLYFTSNLFALCSLLQQSTRTSCTCCIWRFGFHFQLVRIMFTAPAINRTYTCRIGKSVLDFYLTCSHGVHCSSDRQLAELTGLGNSMYPTDSKCACSCWT
jgi:hypothetical protein